MIITLVVLVLLLFGAISVFRSSDSSSALAGQMAFRRDLKNQSEIGLIQAQALLQSGVLSTESSRYTSLLTSNYSAILLPSTNNSLGMPNAMLLNDSDFAAAGMGAAPSVDSVNQVEVRYVIERMCNTAGTPTDANCVRLDIPCAGKGGMDKTNKKGGPLNMCPATVYRISVRVDGPRSTQAFFQTVVAQ